MVAHVLFSCASRIRIVSFYEYDFAVAWTVLLFRPTTCSATLIIIFILSYTVMNKLDEASLRAEW